MIRKSVWGEFKRHPGFMEQSDEIKLMLEDCVTKVSTGMKQDSEEAAWYRGAIWAASAIHDYIPVFINEEDDND